MGGNDAGKWRPRSPTSRSLFAHPICSDHSIRARLRHALVQVYAYYRRNQTLWSNVLRDASLMPAEIVSQVLALVQPFFDLPMRGRGVLAVGWRPRDQREPLLTALGMALDFQVWRALTGQGLGDEQVIAFMLGTIRAWGEMAAHSADGV